MGLPNLMSNNSCLVLCIKLGDKQEEKFRVRKATILSMEFGEASGRGHVLIRGRGGRVLFQIVGPRGRKNSWALEAGKIEEGRSGILAC